MEESNNTVSLSELFVKIQSLPQESLSQIYDLVSGLNKDAPKNNIRTWYTEEELEEMKIKGIQPRACCMKDSLMNTSPIRLENFPINREEMYEE